MSRSSVPTSGPGAHDRFDGAESSGFDYEDEEDDDSILADEEAEGNDRLIPPQFDYTRHHLGANRAVILPPFSSVSPSAAVSFVNFFENNSRMLDGFGDGELQQYDGEEQNNDDQPLFYFCLESFDETQNVDAAVTLEMLETQIIYSQDCFSRVADFFAQTVQVPGAMMLIDQLELAAIEQYNDLKQRTRKKLDFYQDHHESYALNIRLNAPVLVIPDKTSDIAWSTAVVVDLGRLDIVSDEQLGNQDTTPSEVQELVTVFDAEETGPQAKTAPKARPRPSSSNINDYAEDASEDTSSTGQSDEDVEVCTVGVSIWIGLVLC